MTFPPQRGPRVRAFMAQAEADWERMGEARRDLATEYRRAGEALIQAAEAYEHGKPHDVGAAVLPVAATLRAIVNAVAFGRGLRQALDRRDVEGN